MRTERQGPMPSRYSRHCYDLWCMCQGETREAALSRPELLDAVVTFKKKFYRCAWAKYELATAKTISLMLPDATLVSLEADYAHMRNMIFGETPPFTEILRRTHQKFILPADADEDEFLMRSPYG